MGTDRNASWQGHGQRCFERYGHLERSFFQLPIAFSPGFDNLSPTPGKDQIHGGMKCSVRNGWRVSLSYPNRLS